MSIKGFSIQAKTWPESPSTISRESHHSHQITLAFLFRLKKEELVSRLRWRSQFRHGSTYRLRSQEKVNNRMFGLSKSCFHKRFQHWQWITAKDEGTGSSLTKIKIRKVRQKFTTLSNFSSLLSCPADWNCQTFTIEWDFWNQEINLSLICIFTHIYMPHKHTHKSIYVYPNCNILFVFMWRILMNTI